MPDQMCSILEELSQQLAIKVEVVRATERRALSMARAVGDNQLPAGFAQRLLTGKVGVTTDRRTLRAPVNKDHSWAGATPSGYVQISHARRSPSQYQSSMRDYL